MIKQINVGIPDPWTIVGFYDDGLPKGSIVDDHEVLGSLDDLNLTDEYLAIALAIADPATRRVIRERIASTKITFPALIHPSADTGDVNRNCFEEGVLIAAANIFTTGIVVEAFAIVNLHCTIGHDTRIGSFSTVMPGCSLSGAVDIGSEVLIGSGARILPGVCVGDRTKVGAGAVVLDNVASDVTVVGVPARVVKG